MFRPSEVILKSLIAPLCLLTGCLHAVPSQRTVHHGRSGQCIPVHNRWPRFHYHGPNTCARQSETESYLTDVDGFHFHFGFVFHNVDIYANEIAGLLTAISRLNACPSALSIFLG